MIKLIFTMLIASMFIMFMGCSETIQEKSLRFERQHELDLARAESGYNRTHHERRSFADDMALAAAAGFAYSVFTPRYAPTFSNGVYYDSNHRVISRTVYETRINTVRTDKKSYNKKKSAKLKSWKSKPENSKKLKKQKKLSKKSVKASKPVTGSKVAASKKWAGSKGTSKSGWNAAKTSKHAQAKPKPKHKPKKSTYKPSSYKPSSYKTSSSRSYSSSKSYKRR